MQAINDVMSIHPLPPLPLRPPASAPLLQPSAALVLHLLPHVLIMLHIDFVKQASSEHLRKVSKTQTALGEVCLL